MKKPLGAAAAVLILTLLALTGRAGAWSKPTIVLRAADCGKITASLHNPEGTPATVTQSNVFPVGAVIQGGHDLTETIDVVGTITITASVDFPDHADADPVTVTAVDCPHDTTTTTTPSTTPPTTPPPSIPPPEVQCLGQPPHERTTGEEPCEPPKEAQPHFTG